MNSQYSGSRKKSTFKRVAIASAGVPALAFALWLGDAGNAVAQVEVSVEADYINSAKAVTVRETVQNREVTRRLNRLKLRTHTFPPQRVIASDNQKTEVFQYALLDNENFQPNVFSGHIDGINDTAELTAGNPGTIGLARMVVLDKPGVTNDPTDPRAHIGVYVDVSGLKTVKSEAGWYEATLMYTTKIPPVAPPRPNGRAQYGTMTPEDHAFLAAMGDGNNGVVGHVFTATGRAPHYPAYEDVWPFAMTNLVTFPVTAGTFNALEGDDAHHYFVLRPETSMVFPHQEFPFAGGQLILHPPLGAFDAGTLGQIQSIVPGDGPLGLPDNEPRFYGDNPNDPRDPDRYIADDPEQREFRLRSVPSGLTEEIHRDVFIRRVSFHPEETNFQTRLYLALAYEYSLVDTDGDGVLTYDEVDIEGTSDGGQSNERLYFPITEFDRFIIQREINDGMIVPRFANSQRAWVINGDMKTMAGERIRDIQLARAQGN